MTTLLFVVSITEAEREGAQEGQVIPSAIVKDLVVYCKYFITCLVVFTIFAYTAYVGSSSRIFPSLITAPVAQIIYACKKYVVRKYFVLQECNKKNPHIPGVFVEKRRK